MTHLRNHPNLVCAGKYGLDAKGVYGGRERLRMPTWDPRAGPGPFMFHSQLNMGPFIFRRDALRHMGGPNLGFSCRGESGIGFDYELSLRVWYHGYEVRPDGSSIRCPPRRVIHHRLNPHVLSNGII